MDFLRYKVLQLKLFVLLLHSVMFFLTNWTCSNTPSHPFSGICRDAIDGHVYGVQGMMIAVETFRVRKQLIILSLCFEKDTTKSCEKVVYDIGKFNISYT